MIIANLAIGPLILILVAIFSAYPPKSINGLYGYRTTRSMKSQEAWEASNKYAFKLMLWVAIITCIIQAIIYIAMSPTTAVMVGSIVLCVLLVAIIPATEIFLKNNFDIDGKPLDKSLFD